MIRVLHLRSSSGIYGAEQVVLNLASAPNKNVQARVAIFGERDAPGGEFYELCRRRGVDATMLGKGRWLSPGIVRKIGQTIKESSTPVVLHSHDVKSNMHAVLAGKFYGVPVVITQHGMTSDTAAMRIYETIDRLTTRLADAIVYVSPVQSRQKNPVRSSSRRHFIGNGVDADALVGHAAPEELVSQLPAGNLVIGNFSRFSEEKDHAGLLQAFKLVTDDGLEAQLFLAGDGPCFDQIKRLATSLQLSDRTHFLGFRTDIPALFQLIDIYVSSSRTEGLPIVVLEAMAAKIPVIATSVGALPGVLSQNCGLLVEPEQPRALARAMIQLAGDKQMRLSMGQAAHDRVVERYGVEQQLRQYSELYEQVLSVRI